MWRPLIAELAKTHTVIAPDLRGFGDSSKPAGGYDKKTMAQDVHALAASLGHKRVAVVGHDIGLMVAYAYAAQFRSRGGADRLDGLRFSPASAIGPQSGCCGISGIFTSTARPRWRWSRAGAHLLRAFLETTSRRIRRPFGFRAGSPVLCGGLCAARRHAGRLRGVSALSSRTPRTLPDSRRTKLTMPMLVLTGERASGDFLIKQGRLVGRSGGGRCGHRLGPLADGRGARNRSCRRSWPF